MKFLWILFSIVVFIFGALIISFVVFKIEEHGVTINEKALSRIEWTAFCLLTLGVLIVIGTHM